MDVGRDTPHHVTQHVHRHRRHSAIITIATFLATIFISGIVTMLFGFIYVDNARAPTTPLPTPQNSFMMYDLQGQQPTE